MVPASALAAETDRLLGFALASRDAQGFGWLDDDGQPVDRPDELWITCRMTHVFALGHLLGREDCAQLVDHGVTSLQNAFRDPVHGGWFATVDASGPVDRSKAAYAHAFVVLAAASATVAGRPGARELLTDALAVVEKRFWDETHGMVVDLWDETFTECEDYRGINANMHTVEAFLAAADATGDEVWRQRALRITERTVRGYARGNGWRLPEHYDAEWRPRLDYNREDPGHAFRPYGATIGHWLEWARLTLHLRASLGDAAPDWLLPDARELFAAAGRDGWSVDGMAGFVYTVDWDGRPVVRERMHWVAAEAIGAAAALHEATGEPAYGEALSQWWQHVEDVFLDRERGSWHHELDADLRPSHVVWSGKPDVYHALQAMLIPRLPLAPGLAGALAAGALR